MKVEDLIRLLEFCERYDMMEEGKALLKSILPNGEGEKVEPCFSKEEPKDPLLPFEAVLMEDFGIFKAEDKVLITAKSKNHYLTHDDLMIPKELLKQKSHIKFPFLTKVKDDYFPFKKGDIIEITGFVNDSRFDYMVENKYVIAVSECTPIENEPEPTETEQELYEKAYAEGYEKAKLEFEEEKKKIQRESYKEGYNNAFNSRGNYMLVYEDNNP